MKQFVGDAALVVGGLIWVAMAGHALYEMWEQRERTAPPTSPEPVELGPPLAPGSGDPLDETAEAVERLLSL